MINQSPRVQDGKAQGPRPKEGPRSKVQDGKVQGQSSKVQVGNKLALVGCIFCLLLGPCALDLGPSCADAQVAAFVGTGTSVRYRPRVYRPPLEDGLIAHWKMEETGTNPRIDAKGPYDLDTNGDSINATTGKINNASDLTGGKLMFSADDIFLFDDSNFELNGWFKVSSVAGHNSIVFGGGPFVVGYLLYSQGTSLNWTVSSDGVDYSTAVTSSVTLVAGTWYFFRVWHDATHNLIGISINTETPVTASHSGGTFSDSGSLFYLGFDFPVAGGTAFMTGQLDSISVFNRVIKDREGICIYNAGTGADYPWPCGNQ